MAVSLPTTDNGLVEEALTRISTLENIVSQAVASMNAAIDNIYAIIERVNELSIAAGLPPINESPENAVIREYFSGLFKGLFSEDSYRHDD